MKKSKILTTSATWSYHRHALSLLVWKHERSNVMGEQVRKTDRSGNSLEIQSFKITSTGLSSRRGVVADLPSNFCPFGLGAYYLMDQVHDAVLFTDYAHQFLHQFFFNKLQVLQKMKYPISKIKLN